MGQKVQGFRADLQYFSLCGEESRAAESESKEGDSQLSKESCHAQLLRDNQPHQQRRERVESYRSYWRSLEHLGRILEFHVETNSHRGTRSGIFKRYWQLYVRFIKEFTK